MPASQGASQALKGSAVAPTPAPHPRLLGQRLTGIGRQEGDVGGRGERGVWAVFLYGNAQARVAFLRQALSPLQSLGQAFENNCRLE